MQEAKNEADRKRVSNEIHVSCNSVLNFSPSSITRCAWKVEELRHHTQAEADSTDDLTSRVNASEKLLDK